MNLKMVVDGMWSVAINRRKFFETFALNNNFDPLVADNWLPDSKGFKATKVRSKLFVLLVLTNL